MGYLAVGIHENIVISADTEMRLAKDGQSRTLVVGFSTKVDTNNMFAAFGGGEALAANSVGIMMFFKGVTGYQDKVKTHLDTGKDLIDLQTQLKDILKCFMTEDKVNAIMTPQSVFAGLGITPANQATLVTKLVEEDFVRACYENIGNTFVKAVTPFINGPTLRVKLRRTSPMKHFSTIPPVGNFPKPWIESMKVPADASKIGWDEYEIEKKLNSGAPAPSESVPEETAANVDIMMGGAGTAGAVPNIGAPVAGAAEVTGIPVPGQVVETPVQQAPITSAIPQAPVAQPTAGAGFDQPQAVVPPAEAAGFDQMSPDANVPY